MFGSQRCQWLHPCGHVRSPEFSASARTERCADRVPLISMPSAASRLTKIRVEVFVAVAFDGPLNCTPRPEHTDDALVGCRRAVPLAQGQSAVIVTDGQAEMVGVGAHL